MAKAHIESAGAPQIISLITEVKKKAGALSASRSDGVPFPFRGIDGTVNHLAKHVEDAGIVIVPNVLSHDVSERSPDGKRVVKTSKVVTEFTFYAPDGSSISATTTGLADDFADRSAAQAQSVAFRVALLQTFFLPTQSPEPEQTGQVVQDGVTAETTPSATQRKVDAARKPAPAKKADQSSLKDRIRTEFIENDSHPADRDAVNALVKKHKDAGLTGDDVFKAVLTSLEAGEVA